MRAVTTASLVGVGKLIKIGAKVVREGRQITFQLVEVAVPRRLFADSCAASRNTPFDQRPVQGKAFRTIVGGKTVFKADGHA